MARWRSRPPGHHASRDAAWGFCYFNNLAIALLSLKARGLIKNSLVLDIDLHFGDGAVDILGRQDWVEIVKSGEEDRGRFADQVASDLAQRPADIIAVSAGFDTHREDWGRLLARAVRRNQGSCFAVLEGGYNQAVLGQNVLAFLEGMEAG